jgi:hypothetical protein
MLPINLPVISQKVAILENDLFPKLLIYSQLLALALMKILSWSPSGPVL